MSTSALMVQKLKTLGADVVQHGMHWSEADTYLREELLGKDHWWGVRPAVRPSGSVGGPFEFS